MCTTVCDQLYALFLSIKYIWRTCFAFLFRPQRLRQISTTCISWCGRVTDIVFIVSLCTHPKPDFSKRSGVIIMKHALLLTGNPFTSGKISFVFQEEVSGPVYQKRFPNNFWMISNTFTCSVVIFDEVLVLRYCAYIRASSNLVTELVWRNDTVWEILAVEGRILQILVFW